MKKYLRKIFRMILRLRGVSPYMCRQGAALIVDELYAEKDIPFGKKLWAIKKGFLPSRIKHYPMTPENCKFYLSDLDYLKLYPLNNQFRKWIDDKLTFRYVLSRYREFLPEYYFHITQEGEICVLPDLVFFNDATVESILDVLIEKKALAVKLQAGTEGKAFYKLECKDDTYYINLQHATKEQTLTLLKGLRGYIVMEYLKTHPFVTKFNQNSINTVRLMVIKEPNKDAFVANAMFRMGTKNSGVVDNFAAGGVLALVNIHTGELGQDKNTENHYEFNLERHPDNHMQVEGKLPHWEFILQKVLEIANYLGEIAFGGYDIVITEDGFKILEINSHQGLGWVQFYAPILKDNPAAEFFLKRLKQQRQPEKNKTGL